MIQNDQELNTTQQRVADFQRILSQLRVRARPEEFGLVASGYLSEIETMHKDILAYLGRHSSQTAGATAVAR